MPASEPPAVDADRLRRHVARLAAAPRPAGSPELLAARAYVAGQLEECGWRVVEEPFRATSEGGVRLEGVNLVACHRDHPWRVASDSSAPPAPANGHGPRTSAPRLCVGAHLDSREGSPGADDNASAVAALLEIARLLPTCWPEGAALDLELAAFDLEEHGMLGGADRAERSRSAGIDLCGMVSLEMLGYAVDGPRTQALPRSLVGKYPDVGNWIAVIGNQNSGALIRAFAAGMRTVPGLPVETLQVPENGNLLQATRLSDHSPYWDAGYAALMITDTAFLRNPHYHLPSDTPDTLNFEFLTQVAAGCLEGVRRILQAPD